MFLNFQSKRSRQIKNMYNPLTTTTIKMSTTIDSCFNVNIFHTGVREELGGVTAGES